VGQQASRREIGRERMALVFYGEGARGVVYPLDTNLPLPVHSARFVRSRDYLPAERPTPTNSTYTTRHNHRALATQHDRITRPLRMRARLNPHADHAHVC
jgi:hypothetical protein